jgi:hypothetical protein
MKNGKENGWIASESFRQRVGGSYIHKAWKRTIVLISRFKAEPLVLREAPKEGIANMTGLKAIHSCASGVKLD